MIDHDRLAELTRLWRKHPDVLSPDVQLLLTEIDRLTEKDRSTASEDRPAAKQAVR